MLLWHRETVILKSKHVTLNCFPDIRDGGLAAFALGNAARKAWALGYPKAVFTGVNDHLAHAGRIAGMAESSMQLP
jgi:hypothetical protein